MKVILAKEKSSRKYSSFHNKRPGIDKLCYMIIRDTRVYLLLIRSFAAGR